MKKLLLGMTLLTSMSSFAESSDLQTDMNQMLEQHAQEQMERLDGMAKEKARMDRVMFERTILSTKKLLERKFEGQATLIQDDSAYIHNSLQEKVAYKLLVQFSDGSICKSYVELGDWKYSPVTIAKSGFLNTFKVFDYKGSFEKTNCVKELGNGSISNFEYDINKFPNTAPYFKIEDQHLLEKR